MNLIGLSGRRRSLFFWCFVVFLIGRFSGSFRSRVFLIISVLSILGVIRVLSVLRLIRIVRLSVAVAVLSSAESAT